MSRYVLMGNLVASGFMTGLIWFVQGVHYPLFARVGEREFPAYHAAHGILTSWVVGAPILAEVVLGLWLVLRRPPGVPMAGAAAVLGLGLLADLVTGLVSVPLHDQLALGFSASAARLLVQTNWLRTLAWSGRFAVLVWLVGRQLPPD